MAATTISPRLILTDDSGTPASPVGDGDTWDNARLQELQAKVDALVANDITFGGLVHSEGIGNHIWSGSTTAGQQFTLRNTSSGTGAFAQFRMGSDATDAVGTLTAFSSTFVALGDQVQDGVRLNSVRSGGLSLSASHASGQIEFHTGSASLTAPHHVVESTGVLSLQNGLRFNRIITPTQLSADTDDWSPTDLDEANVIRMSSDAARNLAGLAAQEDGRVIFLINVGSFTITLEHDEGTSTAANRFYCPDSADTPMQVNNATTLMYDGTSSRWRIIDLPNQT